MNTPRMEVACVSGLNKTQAEELLDWAEAHGYSFREVDSPDGVTFTVRYG